MRLFKISVATLVFGVALLGWGQETGQVAPPAPGPGGHGIGHRAAARRAGMKGALRRLDLTADQKAQVRNLLQSQRQKVRSIQQDASLTPEQKQDNIKQIRQSTHQQVLGILTPEQQAKLKQFRQQRGIAALNLTPDQRAKLQPIRQQMRQQVLAVRQDTSLTNQQKQERIRDIRQNGMAQMKSVLTPEQQQQLEQMRQRHGQPNPAPPAPEGF